jgi:hypothetical protein
MHPFNKISCRLKSSEIVANSYRRWEELRLYVQRRSIPSTMYCKGIEDEGSRVLQNAG